jgi:tetratricopeptide (TPR) repeat protein
MRARETAPTEDLAAATYCAVLADLQERKQLLAAVQELDDVEWSDVSAVVVVARAIREVGEERAALSWCKKALEIDPESLRALCLSARIYFHDLNHYRRALTAFRKLKKLDPDQHGRDASMYMARIHGDIKGDWKKALETMIEARIEYADDKEIQDYLQRVVERTTGAVKEQEQETERWRRLFEGMQHDHSSLRQAVIEMRSGSEPGTPLGLALVEGEGQTIEFMESFPENVRDLAKEIAAFATSNDGTIYIGVKDDGTVCGLAHMDSLGARDELTNRVAGISSKTIKPSAPVSVSYNLYDGSTVARIFVEKGPEGVYYAGNVPYIRYLDTSRPAEPHEVEELIRRSQAS